MKRFIILLVTVLMVFGVAGCKTKKTESKEYNVIMTGATIPPMVALLETIETDLETYAWIGRQNTIYSVDNLKNAFKKLTFIEEWSTASNLPASVVNAMTEYVTNIWFESGETAKFNVYVTDYGIVAALYMLESNGITSDNYKIHMIEDGSGAYNQFFSNQNYDDETDGMKNFNTNLDLLNETLDEIKEGGKFENEVFSNYNLCYPAATLPNVDYYLQYPQLLTSNNTELQTMLNNKEIKLVEKKQTTMYEALSTEKQELFKSIIIAPSTIEDIKKGDKEKVLMITGTSFSGEGDALTDDNIANACKDGNFESVVKWLVSMYPNYKIIYKGHPSWGILPNEQSGSRFLAPSRYQKVNAGTEQEREITNAEAQAILDRRIAFLAEMNITVLPAQTPAEAIIWAAGDDLVLAGYDSSLYMNAKAGTMLAFFETGISSLSSLNQILYSEGGAFYNANTLFLTKDYCDNNPVVK